MFQKLLRQVGNKHFLSFAGNIIMSVLGMATVALLSWKISIAAFGTWILFQGTLLFIDTFRSGFLTTAFIKFYAGASKERADDVIGSTWCVAVLITVALSLLNLPVIFLLDKVQDEGVRLLIRWFGVAFWLMLPYFMATCIAQGSQRFDRLLYLRFANQGIFITTIILLSITGRLALPWVLYAYLLSFALPSIWVLLNNWSGIRLFKKRTVATMKELYHFGKYSVGTTLSANLFRISDTWIINFLLGPSALAIYNIGGRPMELVEIPLRSFAATGMPELSAAYNKGSKQEVVSIMKKYAGMLTWVLIPFGLIAVLFANVGIGIIGGTQYWGTEAGAQAANVFRLFMTFALLYPADRFMALTLDVIHQPKINFIKVLVMLAANIVFDFAGISIFKNVYGVA
ncbi:MAG: lipopolysaccharide biosynthesis protein, partial [Hymenobacter sp.]